MSLLVEGVDSGNVLETKQTAKHTIDGITDVYPVYRIRIDQLYYNSQNDRIATWISVYRAEHPGIDPFVSMSREDYNDLIEGYIEKSNPDKMFDTKKNIAKFGQRQPGVVLENGLVIDGNRRLTCIRKIAKETGETGWFEATILPDSIASDPKRIKMLELFIQHGEEGKVDYDPVERLVGVYNDIIKNELLTTAEYANSANMSESDVKKMMDKARYMAEFLDFANAPGQYHIARQLKIDGPLGEMKAILSKVKSEGDAELVKQIVYGSMIVEPAGDITRYVRSFKKILTSDSAAEFQGSEENAVADLVDAMGGKPLTMEMVSDLRADERLRGEFARPVEKAVARQKSKRILNAPIDRTNEALGLLNEVLPEMIDKLNENELDTVLANLAAVQAQVDALVREVNARKEH